MNAWDVLEFFDTAPDADVERAYRFVTRIVEARRGTRSPAASQPAPTPIAVQDRKARGGQRRADSVRELSLAVLRDAGKPMAIQAIGRELLQRFGKSATPESIRTMLSRLATADDTFVKLPDSHFGLLEWGAGLPLDQGGSPAQDGA